MFSVEFIKAFRSSTVCFVLAIDVDTEFVDVVKAAIVEDVAVELTFVGVLVESSCGGPRSPTRPIAASIRPAATMVARGTNVEKK